MKYVIRARRDCTRPITEGSFLELVRSPARDRHPDAGYAVEERWFDGSKAARCVAAKKLVASERARIEKALDELAQRLTELAQLERKLK